jgi:hypothetical protein
MVGEGGGWGRCGRRWRAQQQIGTMLGSRSSTTYAARLLVRMTRHYLPCMHSVSNSVVCSTLSPTHVQSTPSHRAWAQDVSLPHMLCFSDPHAVL